MLRVQAIFRKNDPSENHGIFSLQVVKSSIESGTFLTGVQSTMQNSTQTQTQDTLAIGLQRQQSKYLSIWSLQPIPNNSQSLRSRANPDLYKGGFMTAG